MEGKIKTTDMKVNWYVIKHCISNYLHISLLV